MLHKLEMEIIEEDFAHGGIAVVPQSWNCVDCGVNTAPGMFNRTELEKAIEAAKAAGCWGGDQGVKQYVDEESEVYGVRDAVWKAAGMEKFGGCLCISCLERPIGRRLKPKDFPCKHGYNLPNVPGTPRLMKRQKCVKA